ncbi:alpha/beta hydrolase [Paractinoplanes ferrugineus]|uniref:Alpha/beta hydrolase n=1 Tax=Paractinoplanes ferrugineus TaxID=113564 RepID=A0A919IVX1_9ACTN|nr:alpha/beta family hydrolase [Actinoplanes ferrugineus]GIE08797.1 alpha/beta hydrolase [Actinoplanes ferrugineus]
MIDTEIQTPRGPAGIRLVEPVGPPASLLFLGHGAGGGVDAPDLVALTEKATAAGVRVVLVTQPYRVAGRRAPAPAGQLDEAWTAVIAHYAVPALPLIFGGRSSGARVACRTAPLLGAAGVVALAFPLHPPGRPAKTRAAELPAELPTLVLNGDRDAFGVPAPQPNVEVVVRPGATHDLRKGVTETAELAVDWLRRHQWAG